MSNQIARSYSHPTNRAKARSGELERKPVFKSVLDNPFRVQWPSVPLNVQNIILAHLVTILEGISRYQRHKSRVNRAEKRARQASPSDDSADRAAKRRKVDADAAVSHDDLARDGATNANAMVPSTDPQKTGELAGAVESADPTDQPSATAADDPPRPPRIMKNLTVGINAVTKRLETQLKASRQSVVISSSGAIASGEQQLPLKTIFICRADVDPPLLVNHIPQLVSTWNSSASAHSSSVTLMDTIKLVPLPKGAEATLAESLGLRRVAILAFDNESPSLAPLNELLNSIPVLTTPWTLPPQSSTSRPAKTLVPTHIKQVRTSAPKDMKAAKDQRTKGRAAAKEATRTKRKKITITATPTLS
ncbi:hypothetical protein PLICRDRAFT_36303 [Plicaturopsis crispa FD-325 SS-3]|nr:hypothetical protein PLICRDRAFT_36303 [Plicaturopsis crispa FD-325 SS-3]